MGKVSQEDLWVDLKTGNARFITDKYGSVMTALSHGLRGAIIATPGNVLYCADYSGIEARVLMWAAGDEDAVEMFRQNKDIYCDMASAIYNRPITKADDKERTLGKAVVLGCGYQLGAARFVAVAALYGITIDETFSKQVVDAYRTKYWKVKQLWADQEAAAIKATTTGKRVFASKFTWFTEGRFLYCQLPSGRRLAYPFPEVKMTEMRWGGQKLALSHMGVDTYTRKWKRLTVYGGLIVENEIQAVSRDIMAAGMRNIEAHPDYQMVLSVHDEALAEAPKGVGSVTEFVQLLTTLDPWARGCPINAEGWTGFRYRK